MSGTTPRRCRERRWRHGLHIDHAADTLSAIGVLGTPGRPNHRNKLDVRRLQLVDLRVLRLRVGMKAIRFILQGRNLSRCLADFLPDQLHPAAGGAEGREGIRHEQVRLFRGASTPLSPLTLLRCCRSDVSVAGRFRRTTAHRRICASARS